MSRKAALTILSLFLLLAGPVFADRVNIEKPMTYGVSKAELEELDALLDAAVGLANGIFGGYFEAARNGKRFDYSVKIMPVFQAENSLMSVSMAQKQSGVESTPSTIWGKIDRKQARYLANVIFYLWSSFNGYMTDGMVEAPSFVAELPTDSIAQSLLENPGAILSPLGLAVKVDGNCIVALGSFAAELDPYFRIVGEYGKSLLDKGSYSSAGGVAVTPAGTVFLKPITGRDLYYLPAGIEMPIKWRAGIDMSVAVFTGLPDGSVVFLDSVKKHAIRLVGRKKAAINLFTSPYSYVYVLAPGPEGNIWLYDSVEKRIRIHTVEGELIDSVVPVVDHTASLNPVSLAVFNDGRFILYSNTASGGEMYCFRRDGTPLWRMDAIPGPIPDPLPLHGKISVDSNTGLIYLTDTFGYRIIQLLDTDYARKNGLHDEYIDTIVALNERLVQDEDDMEAVEKMAELYKSLGAFEMASLQWERILEIDPFNAKARERLDSLEISLLTVKADNMHSRTMELLETLGPESARTVYTQTIQLYERILSMNPDDKIRNAMEDLKRRFQDKTEPSAPRKPLTIVRAEVDNLFPSLMQYYRDHPVGTVTVKNTLKETAEHLKAAFRIKKYMDFPAVTDWEGTLASGKEARFDLKVIFNDSIFALQEDLPVQAEITVSYQVGGVEYKVTKAVPLTIYRRTALTWEDTGKIASFIMPNEGIVNRFSHKVAFTEGVEKDFRIAYNFFRGIKICDALGMYDVHYIEDPESPISGILGKTGAIDTVRFPRTTLLIQSGDCDDTTVLLASLLESSGVKTAVMTSPGHVFMAMDTGEPEGNRWLFTTDRLEVISHEGRVWIPIETTLLKEGFLAAWTHASGLVKRYSGSIEFLPVDALRDTYPSLPLPESSFTIVEPPADTLKSRFLASVESVSNELYSSNLAGLKSQLSRASGKQSLKLRNQIAVLHARFGEDREAEKEFKRIIRSDPDFLSSYLNLANLNLSRKETDKAISVLKDGLKIKPDTVLLNLLIARAYLLKNKQDMALKHYRIVQERSPGIAEKYAALFIQPGADRDVQRASAADEELPFIWDSGE